MADRVAGVVGTVGEFADRYGPWALIAGASEGVGLAFAHTLAERRVNVALVSRRPSVLDEASPPTSSASGGCDAVTGGRPLRGPCGDDGGRARRPTVEVGLFVYCAGADPNFGPFLDAPLAAAESMVVRNCLVPTQLCHHLARPMAERGRGGIIVVSSGAALVGAPRMVAYGASKAFDLVLGEALVGGAAWPGGRRALPGARRHRHPGAPPAAGAERAIWPVPTTAPRYRVPPHPKRWSPRPWPISARDPRGSWASSCGRGRRCWAAWAAATPLGSCSTAGAGVMDQKLS